MPERRFPVTFAPSGVTVWAEEGSTVLAAARSAGIVIPSPCGGRGVCGKCAVRVLDGVDSPPEDLERRGLKLAPPGMRLACLMRVSGPLTVRPMISQTVSSLVSESDVVAEDGLFAAIDLGTTTVAALVLDAGSGRELGRALVPNGQASWGADVVTRLSAAMAGDGDLLKAAAEDSIHEALSAACGHAGTCLPAVKRLVVAGNTAMSSLLIGADVSALVERPFHMPYHDATALPSSSGLLKSLSAETETVVLPPLGAFVGGDVVAGLVAAGLVEERGPVFFIDAGTNAELALATSLGVTVASAAAGPAFEGSGVRSGGTASNGAVLKVAHEGADIHLDVQGGGDAQWFAGSGLLSALQMLRSVGHLADDGALSSDGPLADRFTTVDGVRAVRLGDSDSYSLLITQTDIRALQTAKAAVSAGVLALARSAKVKPRSIARWVVTGAFGAAVSPEDLVSLGILPADARDSVEQVVDATLIGAAMIAVDRSLLDEAMSWLAGVRHLSLAEDDLFRDTFVAATALREYTLKQGF